MCLEYIPILHNCVTFMTTLLILKVFHDIAKPGLPLVCIKLAIKAAKFIRALCNKVK